MPNLGTPKYRMQTLTDLKKKNSYTEAGDFLIPYFQQWIDYPNRGKKSKVTDLLRIRPEGTDIHRTFQQILLKQTWNAEDRAYVRAQNKSIHSRVEIHQASLPTTKV